MGILSDGLLAEEGGLARLDEDEGAPVGRVGQADDHAYRRGPVDHWVGELGLSDEFWEVFGVDYEGLVGLAVNCHDLVGDLLEDLFGVFF